MDSKENTWAHVTFTVERKGKKNVVVAYVNGRAIIPPTTIKSGSVSFWIKSVGKEVNLMDMEIYSNGPLCDL